MPEHLFFTELATACLRCDLRGIKCGGGSHAVTGWIEYLIERIVSSAVLATRSDYGMSSSLKDIGRLVKDDGPRLVQTLLELTSGDFFTCFVSQNFRALPNDLATTIATTVQKRMMFNRWHFIPGNLQRQHVGSSRHWYYPPTVPDIAVHSHMHRAAHSRAQVKFSVRAPGPDMSRPPLRIAGQTYRGFYDVRVVRMKGDEEFGTEDMLRARRRTLWLEALFNVLVAHLSGADAHRFVIKGFSLGAYLDLPANERYPDLPEPGVAAARPTAEIRVS